MQFRATPLLIALLILNGMAKSSAQQTSPPVSPSLQQTLDKAVSVILEQFAARKLQSNQVAVTLIDLRDSQKPVQASYRGAVPIYPASVIKLFYMAAAHRWMEDGKIKDSEELRRALRDMIVESYNEATHYVFISSGGNSGPPVVPVTKSTT